MEHTRLLGERWIDSRHLDAPRAVRICLPPSYAQARRRRYPVLYLHDGQNMFSSAGASACWGWGNWALDTVADDLCARGQMREIIMVAVDNTAARDREYRGPAFEAGPQEIAGRKRPRAAAGDPTPFQRYCRFLREELKPRIDAWFRTRPGGAHTGLMGSSLGGLCSLAMAWEHPRTYGLVASLSGAFQFENRHFLKNVLGQHQGRRKPLKIYLDSGFLDFRDDDMQRLTGRVAAELRRIGWEDEVNLKHFVDRRLLTDLELSPLGVPPHKWREARQSQHNELYWRLRVERALGFLFAGRP